MTILASGIAQVRHNARLLAAAGLDADTIIAQMNDTAALYSESLACGEAGRQIRAEAFFVEENADVELGDSDREIARMLHILAYNLHMTRCGAAVKPVR